MNRELHILEALSHELPPHATGLEPRGRRPPACRAILFDVYGTLFVSASGDVGSLGSASRGEAILDALRACGFTPRFAKDVGMKRLIDTIEAHHARSRAVGLPHPEVEILAVWRELLSALLEEGLVRAGEGNGRPSEELLRHLALHHEARVNPTWPMPGLAETLEGLQAQGLRLGIVSNAQFYTPLLFELHLGGSPSTLGFLDDACIWSWKLGRAKPDPQLFVRALDALRPHGIQACETLFVGNDMRNDIAPAAALGMKTALFAGDARSLRLRPDDALVSGIVPDMVCSDLRQLLAD